MESKSKNPQINPAMIVFEMLKELKKRQRDIVIKRFNLDGTGEQTLEEIGKNLQITRERVRQIQSEALKKLSKKAKSANLNPISKFINSVLEKNGGAMEENSLLKNLLESKKISKQETNKIFQKQALFFILSLNDSFIKIRKNKTIKSIWAIDRESAQLCENIIKDLENYMGKSGKVMNEEKILKILNSNSLVSKNTNKLSDKILLNWLKVSQKIIKNPFGKWGLKNNSEIAPRGVKDKAYLIVQKAGNPLHFTEITKLINRVWIKDKKACPQTVHNELIKDKRFVLVGRGIYALKEWGFREGTVLEVLQDVLNEKGIESLSKEDIIGKVLKKRWVKRNTVLLNLQNSDYFVKLNNGKYSLKVTN